MDQHASASPDQSTGSIFTLAPPGSAAYRHRPYGTAGAFAPQVLEVDDQAVEHLGLRFHRAVQLGGAHADAVAVDGGVAAAVDDGAT